MGFPALDGALCFRVCLNLNSWQVSKPQDSLPVHKDVEHVEPLLQKGLYRLRCDSHTGAVGDQLPACPFHTQGIVPRKVGQGLIAKDRPDPRLVRTLQQVGGGKVG